MVRSQLVEAEHFAWHDSPGGHLAKLNVIPTMGTNPESNVVIVFMAILIVGIVLVAVALSFLLLTLSLSLSLLLLLLEPNVVDNHDIM
eukprot:6269807-Amphidinium_carterae.1